MLRASRAISCPGDRTAAVGLGARVLGSEPDGGTGLVWRRGSLAQPNTSPVATTTHKVRCTLILPEILSRSLPR